MRFRCDDCFAEFEEGDAIDSEEEKMCPECGSEDITELDDSEYGN